ncbi:B12-binding domain-containing radical SAM protein [Holophaga foetida]|uniref:B12-binding domain-containing radical SAM protein n=1 Tax=Holophaga foetida TaxID=35839 RepID=UPI000247499A|nr:B12-binding domain-containing radical SAM protein [Holophaga foetida]
MKLVLAALHIEPSPRAVPLGPAMLASVLKQSLPTVETLVLDLFLAQPARECAELILASDPEAVGLSIYVWNRTLFLEIAAILKARKPGLVLFAGGAEATADLEGILAAPAIDFVLPGEGEALIQEAMGRLLGGEELPVSFKPAPVPDLAALPSPYLDGTLDLRNYTGALWELSRGCPFKCDFCFESRGTAGIRRIPMERVEAELSVLAASGIGEVFVLDPTFNFHKPQAKAILRLIAERAPHIHFFFEIRSEFIDQEMAELFAGIRCTLQIGLQSARNEVLQQINRSFDPEDFESKLLLLHQAGVPYGFDLIYGLPGDSLEGFCASLDFAMSLVPNHLDVFRLSVLPGTRLAETASSLGLEYEACNPYSVLATPGFPPEDLARAGQIALGCDAFYNQGRAVPWFGLVQEALEMPASRLFEAFALYIEGRTAEDLTLLQRDFVLALFGERGDELMGGIAADLISYFGYAGELMESPEPIDRIVFFNHDPLELLAQLQGGGPSLEELVFSLPAQRCRARLFVQDGEVDLEVLGG